MAVFMSSPPVNDQWIKRHCQNTQIIPDVTVESGHLLFPRLLQGSDTNTLNCSQFHFLSLRTLTSYHLIA